MTFNPRDWWWGKRPIHTPGVRLRDGALQLDHEIGDISDVTDTAALDHLAAETARTDPLSAAQRLFGGDQ